MAQNTGPRPSPGLILAPPQIGLAIFAMEFCTLNCQNKYVGLQLVEVINTTPNVQQMFRHDWATQGSATFRPVKVAKTGIITILHLHPQILQIDSTWWISCLWLSEWKRWSNVSCSQIPSSKTWKNQTTTSENPQWKHGTGCMPHCVIHECPGTQHWLEGNCENQGWTLGSASFFFSCRRRVHYSVLSLSLRKQSLSHP